MGKYHGSTIYEELAILGISKPYFDRFYEELKGKKELPPVGFVPWEEYKGIVDYLRDSDVLYQSNKINPKGLKLFDSRLDLESRLEENDEDGGYGTHEPSGGILPCRFPEQLRNSGGLVSCRQERRNSGGIAPCRD